MLQFCCDGGRRVYEGVEVASDSSTSAWVAGAEKAIDSTPHRPPANPPDDSQPNGWRRNLASLALDEGVVGDASNVDRPGDCGLKDSPAKQKKEPCSPIWTSRDDTQVPGNSPSECASDYRALTPWSIASSSARGDASWGERGSARLRGHPDYDFSSDATCSTTAVHKALSVVLSENFLDERITRLSEARFVERYELGHLVMSTNPSSWVRCAKRRSDDKSVLIKAEARAKALVGHYDEEGERAEMAIAQARWARARVAVPKSPGICELVELIETRRHYYVVTERVKGEDLRSLRDRTGLPLEHDVARRIVRRLLQAVQDLHGAGVIHRSLTLQSVVARIDPEGEVSVKLVDFDTIETDAPPQVRYLAGAVGFNAPEAYDGRYCSASDIYSVGVILYMLLTCRYPVWPASIAIRNGEDYVGSRAMKKMHKRLARMRIDLSVSPLDACPAARELCGWMLRGAPEDRPSAEEALGHEWFSLAGALPERQEGSRSRSRRLLDAFRSLRF